MDNKELTVKLIQALLDRSDSYQGTREIIETTIDTWEAVQDNDRSFLLPAISVLKEDYDNSHGADYADILEELCRRLGVELEEIN